MTFSVNYYCLCTCKCKTFCKIQKKSMYFGKYSFCQERTDSQGFMQLIKSAYLLNKFMFCVSDFQEPWFGLVLLVLPTGNIRLVDACEHQCCWTRKTSKMSEHTLDYLDIDIWHLLLTNEPCATLCLFTVRYNSQNL